MVNQRRELLRGKFVNLLTILFKIQLKYSVECSNNSIFANYFEMKITSMLKELSFITSTNIYSLPAETSMAVREEKRREEKRREEKRREEKRREEKR